MKNRTERTNLVCAKHHIGKFPYGVPSEKCYAATRPAFRVRYPGAGEGIRTPDPLITNQMLYQLSYASKSRDRLPLRANTTPLFPS